MTLTPKRTALCAALTVALLCVTVPQSLAALFDDSIYVHDGLQHREFALADFTNGSGIGLGAIADFWIDGTTLNLDLSNTSASALKNNDLLGAFTFTWDNDAGRAAGRRRRRLPERGATPAAAAPIARSSASPSRSRPTPGRTRG